MCTPFPLRGHPTPEVVQRLSPSPFPPSLLSTLLDQTGLARQIFVLEKSKHSHGDPVVEEPGSSPEAIQSEWLALLSSTGMKWLRALLDAGITCLGISSFAS